MNDLILISIRSELSTYLLGLLFMFYAWLGIKRYVNYSTIFFGIGMLIFTFNLLINIIDKGF